MANNRKVGKIKKIVFELAGKGVCCFFLTISALGVKAQLMGNAGRKAHDTAPDNQQYEVILQRIHKDQLDRFAKPASVQVLDSQVAADLRLLNAATGKYIDLNYSDHKRIGVDWMPAMRRMERMSQAFSLQRSRYYQDQSLFGHINRALNYFCRFKPLPYCNNWYQQGITRPQTLALCLINMEQAGFGPLPDSTLDVTIKAICKDTAVTSPGRNNPMHLYNTGANKAEIALGWIYIGALMHNEHMLAIGARELYAPLKYTTGEGIQYDHSFDMHYGYLYNGAYGAVLLNSITRGAWYLHGTKSALSGNQLQFFSNFIIRSIFEQIRGGSMDWNILGRGVARYNATRPDFASILQRLHYIDPIHKKEYKQIAQRMSGAKAPSFGLRPSHQFYWRTDFTVRSRPGFYLSIHGNSSRNHGQEIGNQENLKGYWGAEGVMDLMVTGKEYVNIFPLWNWKRLPGATLPDTLVIPQDKAPGEGDRKGTSAFCGGISDSMDGLSVYTIQNELGLSAHKAWFMNEDFIYCLGAGIHTDSNQQSEIRTTLNQCFYDSTKGIVIGAKGQISSLNGQIDTVFTAATMPDYILHGNVAYVPLPETGFKYRSDTVNTTALELKVNYRSGSWQGITSRDYPLVSGSVFELSLDHGNSPQKASYCYALLPGVKNARQVSKSLFFHGSDKVVANTDSIQAVYFSSVNRYKNIHQIAFYRPGVTYRYNGVTITSDKPCLVMMRRIHNPQSYYTYKLSVCDPSWQAATIHLQVSIEKDNLKTLKRSLFVDLPAKPYAGSTATSVLVF